MLGDKSHGHHGTAGVSKIVNFLSIIGIFVCEIIMFVMASSQVQWASLILANGWLILNLVFHFLPHHGLISFLRCRVCLVYVLFAFQFIGNLLALIVVAVAGAGMSVVNG